MAAPFPLALDLRLVAKRPARLSVDTERQVLGVPVAAPPENDHEAGPPAVSIVVLTHDNLVFTRMCLESVLFATSESSFELLVVDNSSADGTPDYLRELASQDPRVRPLLMDRNLGFAAGVNLGLRDARGSTLVMLNNDTIVAPGWLPRLLAHLDDPRVGLVGPVTNQAPGAARVNSGHSTYGEFLAAAERRSRRRTGSDVERLTFFCAALPRRVYLSVGPLDERFEVGMFEDDDYCLRIAAAGLVCRLAEDVLVHHFGEATLGRLVPTGAWKTIFNTNRKRFEEKWGAPWGGHSAPDDPQYLVLLERLAAMIRLLPREARVLVASRGDDRLCTLSGRTLGHFPQLPDGTYAGSYPADDVGVIEHLRELGQEGWTHLAFPNPARWWLDHYPLLARHLEKSGVVIQEPATGVVFRLPTAGAFEPAGRS